MAAQVPARARTHHPCAACRTLRRRCDRDCALPPYFPSHEVENFAGVHRVFGASNVIKMIQVMFPFCIWFLARGIRWVNPIGEIWWWILHACVCTDQMVESSRRKDAVKALIYEAKARIRDPVYGNAGAVFYMQKIIQDLKTQLDSTRTQTLALQEQIDQLLGILANVHRIDPVFPTHFPMFADGFLSIHDTASYEPSAFPSDHDQIVRGKTKKLETTHTTWFA